MDELNKLLDADILKNHTTEKGLVTKEVATINNLTILYRKEEERR